MKHYDENKIVVEAVGREAVMYVWRKMKKILPYAAVGIFISFIHIIVTGKNVNRFSLGISLLWNLLCMQETCLARYNLNAPMWYITDIVLFLPLIIIMTLVIKDIYKFYLSWMIPLFCYIFLIQTNATLQFWGGEQKRVIISCFLRGIASMMLGTFAYFLCRKTVNLNWGKAKVLSAVKWLFLVGLICLASSYDLKDMSMDMIICLMLFMFSIFMTEHLCVPESVYLFCRHVGRLALPVYLIHRPLIEIYKSFQADFEMKVLLCLFCTLVVSEMTMWLVDTFYKMEKDKRGKS